MARIPLIGIPKRVGSILRENWNAGLKLFVWRVFLVGIFGFVIYLIAIMGLPGIILAVIGFGLTVILRIFLEDDISKIGKNIWNMEWASVEV